MPVLTPPTPVRVYRLGTAGVGMAEEVQVERPTGILPISPERRPFLRLRGTQEGGSDFQVGGVVQGSHPGEEIRDASGCGTIFVRHSSPPDPRAWTRRYP